mgnify:CR=1 FL=1
MKRVKVTFKDTCGIRAPRISRLPLYRGLTCCLCRSLPLFADKAPDISKHRKMPKDPPMPVPISNMPSAKPIQAATALQCLGVSSPD